MTRVAVDERESDLAEVAPEAVLHFAEGIPGFPEARRFVLSDLADDGVFQLLQSIDEPGLSMVVAHPWLFFPDYTPVLGEQDRADLGIDRPEDAIIFCSVTVDDDEQLLLNLLGPFVVNSQTRVGRQVVLDDPDLPVRARLPAEQV